jgi:hypothetical protein
MLPNQFSQLLHLSIRNILVLQEAEDKGARGVVEQPG